MITDQIDLSFLELLKYNLYLKYNYVSYDNMNLHNCQEESRN